MTLRTHLSKDYSEASASRRQRACYHYSLYRVKDVNGKESWFCEDCDAEFNLVPAEVVNDRP